MRVKDSGAALSTSMLTLVPCLLTAAIKCSWVTSIAMFVLLQVDTDLQKMSKFQTLEKEIITARSSVVNFQQMQ